jgi:hypothetical protein
VLPPAAVVKAARAVAIPLAGLLALVLCSFPTAAATPAGLRSILDKADNALGQAERAVQGKDPGKVSLLLQRADEFLASFQEASGLERLVKALDDGRAAARGSDMVAAGEAVRRASGLMSAVTDYVVLRQAAETSRSAMRAADAQDGPAFLQALDRFDSSILAPVLLARLREARDAVARARQAMVRNNMQDGRARIAEARRAMNGLAYAGALSRASYSLAIGAELLESHSVIAARDQLQKALRDLKTAAAVGPDESRPALEEMRAQTAEIWKRSGRADAGDAGRLVDLARRVDAIRLQQPR